MATTKEWAMKMIPVLIRWAQGTWDKPHTYSDLSIAVGHKTNQIGNVMGAIQDIIKGLNDQYNKGIPTLNTLVCSKSTGLPSDGLDYVIDNYSKLTLESKKGEIRKKNLDAHNYDWDWVLKTLKLEPEKIFTDNEIAKAKAFSHGRDGGGEGKEHLSIKEYICAHPESVNVKGVVFRETEYPLLSGDQLDVYFECKRNKHFAIEVKPSTAPESDITRGIFQCIKYQAVMDASRAADYGRYENEVLLVIGSVLTPKNRQLASDLGIRVIENFHVE